MLLFSKAYLSDWVYRRSNVQLYGLEKQKEARDKFAQKRWKGVNETKEHGRAVGSGVGKYSLKIIKRPRSRELP